ncbi:polymorphic toxin type 44 domain-containing protein [Pseudoalteromonas sp. T1lg21]|uniref:polymorphic toxin type 44 domain-containing protein n=1 Tax=Pseudoalteromonas sp. T1lg21 TaxID=2077095 RepID=UPI000CF6B596|nr:polymorphic toxin type 44 domain-containing protein [Pseudoalteromonas sp. T1lg21]
MKKYLLTFVSLLSLISFNSSSQTSECLVLSKDQSTSIPLKKSSNFFNCFIIEKTSEAKTLEVYAFSNNYQRQKISLFEANSSATNNVLEERTSQSTGANAIIHQYTSSKVGLNIKPTNYLTSNKVLNISVRSAMGIDSVLIEIDHGKADSGPTPPPVVECPHCVNPRSINFPVFSTMAASESACQSGENPPEGIPDNFNINQHLSRLGKVADALKLAADLRTDPSGNAASLVIAKEVAKATVMIQSFAPFQPYDFKHSDTMKGSADFGNWFYGAASNELGYSKGEALRAAAVVQQYQNFSKTEKDVIDFSEMITKAAWAAVTAQGDNPDDPPQISSGWDYNEVRKNDPNAAKKSNSCEDDENSDNTTTAPSSSFGGVGIPGDINGGWGLGGYDYFGPGTCYACMRTAIIDLPRRMN